jgi:predicted metal-dependent HD superfamily phosphohydrolase
MDTTGLRTRFHELCERKEAIHPLAERAWNALERRYSEAWRSYHTLEHITALLEELDSVRHLAQDPEAVEWAIWYHDYIYASYDPRVTDNEEQSAQKASGHLFRLFGHQDGFNTFDQKVQKLILATKHVGHLHDADAQLLVDLDLAILGKDEAKYDRYESQIAEEYTPRPYSREEYRKGRVERVLRPFLARSRIYATLYFYDKYEAQARENLARAIRQLQTS